MYRRIREERERVEDELLAPEATRAARSRGRATPEEPDQYRTAFQRDRDRIIHSKAFRRLKHKTQVFLNPEGDRYVTRLTHTEALGFWAALRDVVDAKTREHRVDKTPNVLEGPTQPAPPGGQGRRPCHLPVRDPGRGGGPGGRLRR